MNSFRRKVRALSWAAVLLALWTAAGIAFSPEARNARISRYRLLVPDPAEIQVLQITVPEGDLSFRRLGGAWTLEEGGRSLPVRAERVEAYLETLGAVRSLSEVSRAESSWKDLGLEEASARRVRLLLKDGSAAADFRVGRYAPDGSRVFLRMEGNPRGFAAPAAIASRLPGSRKAWLDLRLFGEAVPLEDVQSLRISGYLRFPDGSVFRAEYGLDQNLSGVWSSPQIPGLDPSAAGRLVRSWMSAEAEDFSDRGPEAGPVFRADLATGGGAVRSLRISAIPEPEGWYRASLTGSGRYFRMSPWLLKDLLKAPEDLSASPRR